MSLTSRYIRHSLETGHSVWIAQREGRAKDGRDLTDPALIKMISLAYRKDIPDIGKMMRAPVDCAGGSVLRTGSVRRTESAANCSRSPNVAPIASSRVRICAASSPASRGRKGRVHLSIGPPLRGAFDDADSVAAEIDRQIALGYRLFPTHFMAARLAGLRCPVPRKARSRCAISNTRLSSDRTGIARADRCAIRKPGRARNRTRRRAD